MSLSRKNLNFDSDGFVVVYIGDYHENFGRPNAKAGLGVFFGRENPLNRSAAVTGLSRTNNIYIGLIRAANTAIYMAGMYGYRKLCIRTDSYYLLESMLRSIKKWKQNGWIGKDGRPVENKLDFHELLCTMERYEMRLKWQLAPSRRNGIRYAHQLAARSAKTYKNY